ncbi:MAG: hypothetical protein K6U89_03005 [Chloroflexi bacterium]|nr:hypothetical protein [Chloroflexota bacterium]
MSTRSRPTPSPSPRTALGLRQSPGEEGLTSTLITPEMTLRQRYHLFRAVGSDEAAELYVARDLTDDAPVRVRLFFAEAFPDRTTRLAAVHQLAAALNWHHPGAVPLRELGVAGSRLYVVTERPRGAPLRERLLSGEPMALPLAASVIAQALGVVEAALAAGLSHPGLTPDNLFLNPFGAVEVGDIGQPVPHVPSRGEPPSALYVRALDAIAGQPASVAAQLYSAAALVLWLASGTPPFPGETAERIRRRHRSRLAPSLATLVPTAPPALVAVVARSLRKDPAGRPTSLAALREPLLQVAAEATWPAALPAEPALDPRPAAPAPRRRLRLPFRRAAPR